MPDKVEARSLAFSALGQRLSSVATPMQAAEIIVEIADELIGWDASSFFIYLPENVIQPVLVIDVVNGQRTSVSPAYGNTKPSPLIKQVLEEGGKLILREENPALSPQLVPFGDASRPSASLMFVPSRTNSEVVGVLSIQSYRHYAYTSEDLETLQALADHCAGAIKRIRAQENSFRLAAIVESSNDAIIGGNLNDVIASWNHGAEKIFGYSAKEMLGQSIKILLPPDRQDEEQRVLELIKQGNLAQSFETLRLRKDGRVIEVSLTPSPIRDAAGNLIGVSKILQDITERRRMEKRLAALSRLGRELSKVASPLEAARVIADITQDLFGWDALTLDAYSPEADKIHPIWNIDTINGVKTDVPPGHTPEKPTPIARRVMALGTELVLKKSAVKLSPGDIAFGDVSRPSASIMRVTIQYRNRIIGLLSLHSYTLNAYQKSDLTTLRDFSDFCAGALERLKAEEKMATLSSQLLNAARRSGMEEATNQVLHNVGNVLNSVNVSANLVAESLKQSRMGGLDKVNELLKDGLHDLGRFFSENTQAKQLPGYLDSLGKYWISEQATLLAELEQLTKHVAHVKSIITRQQSSAGISGFMETVFIADMLEDALALGAPDLAQARISVKREYTMHFQVVVDNIKLMVILVNLVSNARDALLASPERQKILKLRTEAHQDRLRIVVADNGTGIAPENLTRIFSQGFTTKKNGHGFGLHGSALAACELNGSLTVQSSGSGKGAEFHLEIPLKNNRTTQKLS